MPLPTLNVPISLVNAPTHTTQQALESDTKVLAYEAGRKHKVRRTGSRLACLLGAALLCNWAPGAGGGGGGVSGGAQRAC